jgi:hypothetical protein
MTDTEVQGWLVGRLPEDWFEGTPEVTIDREEIVVIGRLALPAVEGGDAAAQRSAAAGRIKRFREETRDHRIAIAREAEHRYRRKVAWGAECGETRQLFTSLSIPVMTRLRQPERLVLDTLVDAGVARSRSDALAWCVRLVGQHQGDWITELREALVAVEKARAGGPAV